MTPASRRAGLVAGLVLSLVCALGFAHRNTGDIAERCRAEMDAREAKDAELESARAAHAAEMEAVNRRIASLESDVARERGLREEADRRAEAAARPGAELEAAQAELARAYGRIRELEQGGAPVPMSEMANLELRVGDDGGALSALPENGHPREERLVVLGGTEPRIRARLVEFEVTAPSGALNQGVDYVAPAGPQVFEGGLNQGAAYVDPAGTGEELERIRGVVEQIKQIQKSQEKGMRVSGT